MCARRRYENSFVFRPTVNKSLSWEVARHRTLKCY
jgi:hypothetical protein